MNPADRQFTIRARAIIIHENKLLIIKQRKKDDFYTIPGGKLEWGEDIKKCLKREIIEELGVISEIGRLLYINTFIEKDSKQAVEFFFEVTNASDFLNIEKLFKSHGFEIFETIWIDRKENLNILPKKISEDFKNGEIMSDTARFISDL
jgi:ADP-ribose pyrophosphatase YjhB (NUDIX family)